MKSWQAWLTIGFLLVAVTAPVSAQVASPAPADSPNPAPTPSLEGSPSAPATRLGTTTAAPSPSPSPKCDQSSGCCGNYSCDALWWVSLLLAFLTVVGIWKIPPSSTRLTAPQSATEGREEQKESGAGAQDTSPFGSNLGRTVVAGLGGIAAIEILHDAFPETDGFNPRAYYLFWFICFFLLLLLVSSLLRAWTESIRSRVAAGEEPVPDYREGQAREGQPADQRSPEQRRKEWKKQVEEWRKAAAERRRRRGRLVFLDTFFNVIQGNNQLQSAALGDTILDLQLSLKRAADRLRDNVQRAVRSALIKKFPKADIDDQSVRVSVSILSPDGSSLSYVVASPGSLSRYFDRRSVAWVAVHAGQARWWKQSYQGKRFTLFDNSRGVLPEDPPTLCLDDYFQQRQSSDYEAFVVLPVPWYRRSMNDPYRKGGLHISFHKEKFLDALFQPRQLESKADQKPLYCEWRSLLEKPDPPEGEKEPPPAERAVTPAAEPAKTPVGEPPVAEMPKPSTQSAAEKAADAAQSADEKPPADTTPAATEPPADTPPAETSPAAETPEEKSPAGETTPAEAEQKKPDEQVPQEPTGGQPPRTPEPIWIEDEALRVALSQAIDVLGELLRRYNEEVMALANR